MTSANNTLPFRYLVIAGGAERGLAYCGALQALREIAGRPLCDAFEGFAGTSIGATIALLMAIGFEPSAVVASWLVNPPVWPIDMRGFIESNVHDYGEPTGRACVMSCLDDAPAARWLAQMVSQRIPIRDPTFAELHGLGVPDLVVCATSMGQRRAIYYSWRTTPNVRVLFAVRASMAIAPLVAAQYDRDANDFVVDGGFADNFPFETAFDSPHETLGLCFAPPNETRSVPRTRIDYVYDVFSLAFYCHQAWRIDHMMRTAFGGNAERFQRHVVELRIEPATLMRLDLAVSRHVASSWFQQGWDQLTVWWARWRGDDRNIIHESGVAPPQGDRTQQHNNHNEQDSGACPPCAT